MPSSEPNARQRTRQSCPGAPDAAAGAAAWDEYMRLGGCAYADCHHPATGIAPSSLMRAQLRGLPQGDKRWTLLSVPMHMYNSHVGPADGSGEFVGASPTEQADPRFLFAYGWNNLADPNAALNDLGVALTGDNQRETLTQRQLRLDDWRVVNFLNMAGFCEHAPSVKFSFPRFCTCGAQGCLAPVLNLFMEYYVFLYEEFPHSSAARLT